MKEQVLRSMAAAPRDGTVFIGIYSDFSGMDFVVAGVWEGKPHWLTVDDREPVCELQGTYYAGWFAVPEDIAPRIQARVERNP